ncbi:MAG: hydrogen gas-evolving membrane-bound hydrogenase subunit E, partial [Paracoccaceae bacterium]|nr:hydrogen gas-evolving membrane-bound hydrogenase subunit E [Paracoccaceae bacterium]
ATFKAALFMSAGIVDHEAHTRDIKRLGGLRHLMPVTFTIATVAGLSMAGIPLFNGFLSKEMMLDAAANTVWQGNPWIIPALATMGALFSVAYSFRLIVHTFLGPKRDDYPAKPHDPGFGMWASPALLAVLVVLIGIMPALMVGPLVATASSAVIGGELPYYSLKIWHGVNTALFLSITAVVGGLILLALHRPLDAAWIRAPRPEAKAIFDALLGSITRAANALTDGLHNGAMTRYAAVFTLAVIAAGTTAWFGGSAPAPAREVLAIGPVPLVGWFLLVVASGCMVAYHRNRLLALVLMGIVGLIVSVAFAYMSAPDLALTQFSVEVVTIILLLLALNFLPKNTPVESSGGRRLRDSIIAILGGVAVGGLALAVLVSDFSQESISAFHLANSKPGGGGTNVVNVILVDFRGFDTFGEIIVLGIAALVIFAMTESVLGGPVGAWLKQRPINPNEAGDRHPLMMVVATRVMMPIAIMVGVFIFLRGHNEPGGGFIAGLIVAIALVMQYMASGFDWATARQRYPYHMIIALGIFAAAFTGIGSWFADRPFLTSNYGYFQIPPMGEFELATAMAFDVGVFLCVVGAVMLALESLSRFAHRAGDRPSPYPMDIDPSRDLPQEAKDA